MSFEHLPKGTFLKIDSVPLIDTSKAAALARLSFGQRNAGFYTAIVEGNLVACAHIDNGISPEVQSMLDAKNQMKKEAK